MSPVSAPRVLVVDDEPDLRGLVVLVLEQMGCSVSTAADGVEALAAIAQARPDLVVLDVMMPRLDGHEVARRLRADPATERVPILMLTARASGDDVAEGYSAGAFDYLEKPFNTKDLESRAQALLAQAQVVHGISRAERVAVRRVPGGGA